MGYAQIIFLIIVCFILRFKLKLLLGFKLPFFLALSCLCACACGADSASISPVAIEALDERFSDERLFTEELNLGFPGLEAVREAVETRDWEAATAALGEYFRNRTIPVWEGSKRGLELTPRGRRHAIDWARGVVSKEKLKGFWTGPYSIDYFKKNLDHSDRHFTRMYWWSGIANGYLATGEPEVARVWVGLFREFLRQAPPPEDGRSGYFWEAMKAGIRLRTGWARAFAAFLPSEAFTDRDIVNFVKSVIEQAGFIQRTHWPRGNKIAFAMVGLYAAGATFPELERAPEWRAYALEKSVENLETGYLPDDMHVELSPGYHFAFKNYLTIVDIARVTDRGDNALLGELVAGCEDLFALYPKLVAPDGTLPKYQDTGTVRIRERMERALDFFPDNPLFQWFATGGQSGTPPDYRSIALPYAGYVAMRTGWESDATYVGFDAGPIGDGHAHQDKLNLVLWAYGRPLLIDPGHGRYGSGDFSDWARDTFSHNTGLVDKRPQRRKWGKSGGFMPWDGPLADFSFETSAEWDRAAGVYDGAYGLPGPSDSYPYGEDSNFREGWGRPAAHHRRVFFLHPDVVLVADDLVSKDGEPHDYERRWTLDSTETAGPSAGDPTVASADPGQPNLAVTPLEREGLETDAVSAQEEPEILGWDFSSPEPEPATTVRHRKPGGGTVRFRTLLLPARPGETLRLENCEWLDPQTARLTLSDGRILEASVPANPSEPLLVSEAMTKDIASSCPPPRMRSIILTRDHWPPPMSTGAR